MNLLFVCTHNACRSVLAECITRKLAGDRITVASAGSEPAGRIHPLTLEYLRSIGQSVDGLQSKGFDDLGEFRPDVVITVCDRAANETCPVWISENAIMAHWGLADPSHLDGTDAERQAAFESVTGTLRDRIEGLLSAPFETMDKLRLAELLNKLGRL
jgi:arsenate reductase